MKRKTKRYEDSLIESLKNPIEAAVYLTVHIEDDSKYAEENISFGFERCSSSL